MTTTLTASPPGGGTVSGAVGPRRWGRFWRGPAGDPRWARPALFGLLALAAVLYLVDLSNSGWANAFYSAAAQAGSQSWKALFFGSSDAANAITVDKTPGAVWFMALSVRVFGLSSFAILLPQALMGIASVGLLYTCVKRVSSPAAGLLAGLVLALTPVAALMFRFNNPDALLVLLLVAAGWAMTRAVEDGRTRWLLWCGAFIGIAFLAKMMQAFLVVPGFAAAYLVAGPPRPIRRVRQLLLAGVAMLVAGGWWVLIVQLWPASSRPFIGGSQSNSVLDLMFGYNGFGRLTGDEVGSVGWQDASSVTKLIGSELGGQISWLLPAALIGLVAGLLITARRRRTDPVRAGLIGWGGWLLVTGVTFTAMKGINHAYYAVALAPAIAALVGIGAHLLWQRRHNTVALGVLAGSVVISGFWSKTLLERTPSYVSWLPNLVLYGSIAAAVLIVLAAHPAGRPLRWIAALLATLVVVAGPTAYTVATVDTGHTGALPTAGPAVSGSAGFGGTRPAGGFGRPAGGGLGGLLDSPTPGAELTSLLQGAGTTWAAAVVGSNNAAGYQLASQQPVMAVGGFNGTDPAPMLAEFQQLVATGRIHYFIGGSATGAGSSATSGSDTAQQISAWVSSSFVPRTIDGVTVYDLTTG